MTAAENEAVRAASTRFAVVPRHEQLESRPSSSGTTYLVVDKRDEDAQEVARETDSRRS
jgi:hypothetical protein